MTEYGVDFSISHFWSTHLVGGCSFYMSNITCFSYFFKKKIFSITIPYSWKNHGNIHLAHFYYIQETLYLSAFQAFLFVKTFHRRELYCSLFKLVYVHIYVLILFLPTKLYWLVFNCLIDTFFSQLLVIVFIFGQSQMWDSFIILDSLQKS